MVRPNERALRGRNDVVASPGAIDASSGGMALARSLDSLGRVAMQASKLAGDELTRQVIDVERQRGREAALEGETTTLANGQQVPVVGLRSDNTIASQAFNQGVMDILPNRLQASLIEAMDSIEREQRGNPQAFVQSADAFFQGFSQNIPPELKDDFELQFTRMSAAGARRQSAILARRETDRARFENANAMEADVNLAQREAFNLVTVNPEERALSGAIVNDARERIEERLEAVDPMGDPIYTAAQKKAVLDNFDKDVITASALGGFERAIDKEAYVEKWIDAQRADQDISFDVIDSVSARLMTELRLHNSRTRANQAEFKREVNAAVDVLGSGRDVPGILDIRQRAEARGDMVSVEQIDTALAHKDAALSFSQMPLAQQDKELALLREKPAADAIDAQRNLALERALTRLNVAAKKALNPNSPSYAPYAYAESVGVVPEVMPLQTFSAAELNVRKTQRNEIENALQTQVPFLRPGEADAITTTIETGDVDVGLGVLRQLNNVSDSDKSGIARQLSAADPAIARAYQLSSVPGSVSSAGRIIEGIQLLKAENIGDVKPTATAMRTALGTVFEDIGGADPAFFATASQAVEATYLSLLTERGETDLNQSLLNQAAQIVAGAVEKADGTIQGGTFRFGGKMMLPPSPGVGEDEFEDLLGSLSQEDMTTFSINNQPPVLTGGNPLTPEMLMGGRTGITGLFNSDPFSFESVGFGRYIIRNEAGDVVKTTAGPYVIDLGRAWRDGRGQ